MHFNYIAFHLVVNETCATHVILYPLAYASVAHTSLPSFTTVAIYGDAFHKIMNIKLNWVRQIASE